MWRHLLWPLALAASQVGAESAESLYAAHCKSCHGEALAGGTGPSLLTGNWQSSGEAKEIAEAIAAGGPAHSFAGKLDPGQIRALVVLIKEHQYATEAQGYALILKNPDGSFEGGLERYKLDPVATFTSTPWALESKPDGSFLVTLREGRLLEVKAGQSTEIGGVPKVLAKGQGGLLDVAWHPVAGRDWVYLTYSEASAEGAMTSVVRGEIKGGKWTGEERIYSAPAALHGSMHHHFGSRLVFQGGHLYFGVGDRGEPPLAQDLSRPNGKIHRLQVDGKVPADNPFATTKGALPTIYSYGHRNPQGMALLPDGQLVVAEHGPRGGDEINIIEAGANYGWPNVTYGIDYSGKPLTQITEAAEYAPPVHYWVPSLGVTAVHHYDGDALPNWKGGLLVGSLVKEELRLLRLRNGQVVADQLLLKDQGRIRDIATGVGGEPYLLMETDQGGALVKVTPLAPVGGAPE